MSHPVKLACQTEVRHIPLSKILPSRMLDIVFKRSTKYKCIEASMRELGLIEPLIVFPQSGASKDFLLLDGHVRFQILKDFEATTAKCLIATDDEAFTYNHKVNRLNAIQEHYMILQAIKNGVSEERMARTLHVNIAAIRQKRDLLDGLCPEVIQIMRDKAVTANSLRELRKVLPMRQLEIAELMCATHTFHSGYVKCLVAATPLEQMLPEQRTRQMAEMTAGDVARIEDEMSNLAKEFKVIEETHGQNTLKLVVITAYLRKLMENSRIDRFLTLRYPEIRTEFQKIVDAKQLMDSVDATAVSAEEC